VLQDYQNWRTNNMEEEKDISTTEILEQLDENELEGEKDE
jgi:hypothetical protein